MKQEMNPYENGASQIVPRTGIIEPVFIGSIANQLNRGAMPPERIMESNVDTKTAKINRNRRGEQ